MKIILVVLLSSITLLGCSDRNAIPTEDPNSQLSSILFGYRLTTHISHGPAAIGEANLAYWVRSLVTGYEKPTFTNTVLQDNTIDHVDKCLFDFPVETKNTQAVFAEGSYDKADIFVHSSHDISRRVKNFMDEYKSTGKPPKTKGHHFDSFSVATVYVARTVEDTTLVLISNEDNMIWNIQAENGEQIKNIAIITPNTPAIVNAPEGATIQALSQKYSPHCFIEPARPPQEYWSTVKTNEARNFRYTQELEEIGTPIAGSPAGFIKISSKTAKTI